MILFNDYECEALRDLVAIYDLDITDDSVRQEMSTEFLGIIRFKLRTNELEKENETRVKLCEVKEGDNQ